MSRKYQLTAILSALMLILVACGASGGDEITPTQTEITPTQAEITPEVTPEITEEVSAAPEIGLRIGDIAPDFITTDLTGNEVRLSDFRGQVVLLNFWATWCGPCQVEMPEFQSAYTAHQEQGFTILAVNNQEPSGTVSAYRDELGLSFPIVLDERGFVQERYALFSYPTTFLIDENGIIQAQHFGPLLGNTLDTLLAEYLELS